MDTAEALARLKFLVRHDNFKLVNRKKKMAVPISIPVVKEVVKQLSIRDFVKHEPNRNNPMQFVWVFKTIDGHVYYIKFVFINHFHKVVFISFHINYY